MLSLGRYKTIITTTTNYKEEQEQEQQISLDPFINIWHHARRNDAKTKHENYTDMLQFCPLFDTAFTFDKISTLRLLVLMCTQGEDELFKLFIQWLDAYDIKFLKHHIYNIVPKYLSWYDFLNETELGLQIVTNQLYIDHISATTISSAVTSFDDDYSEDLEPHEAVIVRSNNEYNRQIICQKLNMSQLDFDDMVRDLKSTLNSQHRICTLKQWNEIHTDIIGEYDQFIHRKVVLMGDGHSNQILTYTQILNFNELPATVHNFDDLYALFHQSSTDGGDMIVIMPPHLKIPPSYSNENNHFANNLIFWYPYDDDESKTDYVQKSPKVWLVSGFGKLATWFISNNCINESYNLLEMLDNIPLLSANFPNTI